MKIVFNTSSPNAAASLFYQQGMQSIEGIKFFDQNYKNYDVALFMTYDYTAIERVKRQFPHLKIGLIDARTPHILTATPYCDFLIVDSVEMEDYWRIANKPIFRYAEYPNLSIDSNHENEIKQLKKTRSDDTVYIGYHGNALHIMEGANNVSPAIEKLGEKYNIQLLLMHNTPPGHFYQQYKDALPKNITSKCVPWSMENYKKFLSWSDIGIVPNNLGSVPKNPSTTGDPNTDYCLSCKMTSNPGRFIVFGILGIPVVADFYPSSLQYLQNGRGFVAHSEYGWYHSLEQLICSPELRKKMGKNLQQLVKEEFDFEIQNKKFISFLETMI